MKILFRADSSSQIGLGHIMRDLVLASEFKDADIIFACQDLDGNIIDKIHYPTMLLESSNIDELIEIIVKNKIDMLVIDHYDIDYENEKKIKESTGIKIFSFDDTYKRHHCDILLNHNAYAKAENYKGLVPINCELRCGSKYTLLRKEFKKAKSKKRGSRDHLINIFIAMGGTDHSNKNIEILKVLENFSNLHSHVVTTNANNFLEQLKAYVENKEHITLHINSNEIAKLMSFSDFAIVTPSVTLNEILYMGLPFIAIKTSDNQDEMYQYLLLNNYLSMEIFDTEILKNLVEKLMQSLKVDFIDFIDLSLEEKKMVLKWRNDEDIRKWMFTQEKITLDEHLNYIESLKTRDDRLYFLVKKEKQSIGVIDFTNIDFKNKSAEFGVYAKPNLKGMGNILMSSIIDYAFRILKVETLISKVFEENVSAMKLYKRYNFKKVNHKQEKIVCLELKYENR